MVLQMFQMIFKQHIAHMWKIDTLVHSMFSLTVSSFLCLRVCPLVFFSVGSFSLKLLGEIFLILAWWRWSVIAKSDIIRLKEPKMAKVCQTMSRKVFFSRVIAKKLSSIQIIVFFQVQFLKKEWRDCV